MKSWRRGFIRWRTREEPCGSHHVEARASKWDISEALTEVEGLGGGGGESVLMLLFRRLALEGMAGSIFGRARDDRERSGRARQRRVALCRSNGLIFPVAVSGLAGHWMAKAGRTTEVYIRQARRKLKMACARSNARSRSSVGTYLMPKPRPEAFGPFVSRRHHMWAHYFC